MLMIPFGAPETVYIQKFNKIFRCPIFYVSAFLFEFNISHYDLLIIIEQFKIDNITFEMIKKKREND